MNMNVLLAALAAGIVSFFLGWLVFGIALMGYYDANMLHHEGLMKADPNMIGLVLSNLAGGAAIAYVVWKAGARTAMAGFLPACIIGLLFATSYDLFNASFMMMYKTRTIIVVDILLNGAFGGVLGMVAGMVLGMGKKEGA
ncbi:MAG: hypothetical protein IPI81_10305 [Flavobacteriales bacterium]|nr:hypothetical protein [Flavobacteriales bacterium]MCC6939678.1 hypothetical protein [Flavobacteriales bacterium]